MNELWDMIQSGLWAIFEQARLRNKIIISIIYLTIATIMILTICKVFE